MECIPQLYVRKAVSVARAQGMNRQDGKEYFDLLTTTLNEHGSHLTSTMRMKQAYNLTMSWKNLLQ
jgi:hypothetical protein